MIATLTAALLFGQTSASPPPRLETFELVPTDDVWVYPNSSDPGTDTFLRCWGAGGKSVDQPGRTPDIHSYSYLRFDLSTLPKRFKINEASLTLFHNANPVYTEADSAKAPLEVRALVGDFSEKDWTFERSAKVYPDGSKEGLLASAVVKPGPKDAPFAVKIDLAKPESKFPALLVGAIEKEKPTISLALCSALSPEEVEGAVYKVFSKDGPKETRPVLRIVLERVPVIR
jgi:hypothetical protein